jgi:hypothetical protein
MAFKKLKKINGQPPAAALILLFISLSIFNLAGCCSYSFTGASVPAHLNSIAIPVADDRSGAGEPGLREYLTEQLVQRFIDDNSLQVAERTNADAVLECFIASVNDAPNIITAGENVAQRRITISVQVIYRDLVQRRVVFEKTFSNFGLYESTGSPDARRAAIEDAVVLITEDILLDTVSGW